MPYALRIQDSPGGPYYARKCGGYGQTTDSSCCGGQTYCRAEDCCNAERHRWYPSAACGNTDGCQTGVIRNSGACWRFVAGGPLSREDIESQYPGEPIMEAMGPCLPDCTSSGCPDCPEECCYIAEHEDCTDGPTDCDCVRGPCLCGARWGVTWNGSGSWSDFGCLGPGHSACRAAQWSGSGYVEWYYTEVVEGICDLVRLIANGTMSASIAGFGSCSGATCNATFTIDTPVKADAIYGFSLPNVVIGCGQSIREVMGTLLNNLKNQMGFCGQFGIRVCAGSTGPCSDSFDQACGNFPGEPGIHWSYTDTKGCMGGAHHSQSLTECDIGCDVGDECNSDFSYIVNRLADCTIPPHDVAGGIGGVEAPPPDVGGMF